VTLQINGASAPSADPARDAWDRLAALAVGGTAARGGCSAQAHDCACLAEHGAAERLDPVLGPGSHASSEPSEPPRGADARPDASEF
jgi:hypothetical protein